MCLNGAKMIIKSVNLEKVCGITSIIEDSSLPEAAFAGKSNVGKSSLINALMNRKAYARISQSPGKTQTVNYYNINDTLYLVDLPGYGFAKVSQKVKEQWGGLVERYLNKSHRLFVVFLLVDIRHEPSDNDRLMYEWISQSGAKAVIIATKADKIKRSQLMKQLSIIRRGLGLSDDIRVIPFSSLTKQGRDEIWEYIEERLR